MHKNGLKEKKKKTASFMSKNHRLVKLVDAKGEVRTEIL
jgi:hypothetical protein